MTARLSQEGARVGVDETASDAALWADITSTKDMTVFAQAWLAMIRRVLGLTHDPDAVKLVHLKMTISDAFKQKHKGQSLESLNNPNWLLRNMK